MNLEAVPETCWDDVPAIIGMASLVQTAYQQGDLQGIWRRLLSRVEAKSVRCGSSHGHVRDFASLRSP